jgi:hypothetical protein
MCKNCKCQNTELCNSSCSNQKKKPYLKSNAIKYLESLAIEDFKLKHNNFPLQCMAPRNYRDDSANSLTKCVLEYLRLRGWQAERITNMGRQISTRRTYTDVLGMQRSIGSTKWIPGTGTNGTADISSIIKGRSVKIEIKYGKDHQSVKQKLYQESVERAGGIYMIASTFEQFFEWHNIFTNEK